MKTVVVVSKPSDWPLALPGVDVVLARDYLTDPDWVDERGVRLFNLARSYRYQSEGYYVSLLAAARNHRPFPGLMTVLDMKSRAAVKMLDEELEELIQKSLSGVKAARFELSVYFRRNMARRHERLAARLFAQFPAPLLRAAFVRSNDRWRLSSVSPIAFRDVPDEHMEFLQESAREYFARPTQGQRRTRPLPYALAILHDEKEELAPSDPKALARFRAAAEAQGFRAEMIGRDDYGRLAEFDALFIRETTAVNHHTFRFAQRAEAEGAVVIDDPRSILRCTNKVFQAEVFAANGIPTPVTYISDSVDAEEAGRRVGFPCVLKVPDSAFSKGVLRCADPAEYQSAANQLLESSDLFLVQEYLPSDFDWRVGVIGGEALYACRYHMARGHWQIVKKTDGGSFRYGRVEPVPLDDVPAEVLRVGLRAAASIGDGLYGVDLKQVGDRVVVTEVNDNPNIDAGCEDALLKDGLYERIMRVFRERVERSKQRPIR